MNPAERLARLLAPLPSQAMVPVEWVRTQLADPPVDDGDPLTDLTVEQAAQALGRRPSTVRGWCSAGLLPDAYRLGRTWRIPRANLRRYGERSRDGDLESPPRRTRRLDLGSWRRLQGSREGDGEG